MKSHFLRNKLGRILLASSFLVAIGVVSSTAVQAQWWPQNRDNRDRDYRRNRDNRRDRDYRRDDRNGRNSINQVAINDGYRDGVYTGQRDAQRGQSYNPQRSHFYRNGHGDNGRDSNNGRYGGGYNYEHAYRQGFLSGYDQGFRQHARNNRRNGNNRWPW